MSPIKIRAFILWATMSILALSGCSKRDVRAVIAADFPSVDGSTSAHPLQRTIACDLLGAACDWSAMTEENVQRTIIPTADNPDDLAQQILDIVHNGTHEGYVSLIEGQADIILVARAPSPDEFQAADEAGVTLDVQAVALDAFVFLVNVNNPVENLTQDEIRQIYTGDITSWGALGIEPGGDQDAPIHAYQRDRNSGSQELMEDLVMGELTMIDAPNLITTSMVGPLNAIGGNPWLGDGDELGLGYSIYYYVNYMFPHEFVKLVAVDGVYPDANQIASRSYPLTTEVYAVIREGMPANSTAVLLRDWMLSEDGQRVIAASGYVPVASR